ncbi:MAG: hypothetical protein KNN13_03335 [Hydrogenobacter thermophilus]|uniref:hypothetical protein n=1 Tax=Hydrogenobacter thermophilus TaxID=940 RepID=UPI001C73F7BA|nr:hypothetical protein [Hydrogenobacter thermophilus]QWK20372.1 MAG: hypothetical protein KNN13_03335 [Hydrogenobacter thermophilus]
MDIILAWFFFLGKLLLLMLLIGVPLILIIVFLANAIYKRISPKYEELREKRMKELKDKDQSKP